MNSFVTDLKQISRSDITEAGGKAANLGELMHIDGINVPEGFCITTSSFQKVTDEAPSLAGLLDRLSSLNETDYEEINELSKNIRHIISGIPIPKEILDAVIAKLSEHDPQTPYAIRSSATAEDLPTASFAGQYDTFLNVIGKDAVIDHIRLCWASLYTERAISYRIRNGYGSAKISLAVIIQQMIFPQCSGVLFTADPVNGNRKTISIDAGFGLGEALVSGLVNPDVYKVNDHGIIDKIVSSKKMMVIASGAGGTREQEIEQEMQNQQVLTDRQIITISRIARKIETHFSKTQDIEWCMKDDIFYITQSRPVTALYPIPDVGDNEDHVYISVGHQQMMTDVMKPLGLSFYRLTAGRSMYHAGGRLFVDIAKELSTTAGRNMFVNVLGKSDPLIKDALMILLERDFIKLIPDEINKGSAAGKSTAKPQLDFTVLNEYDPSIVTELIEWSEISVNELKKGIRSKTGTELFEFILEDISRLRKFISDPKVFAVIMTGMNVASWINEKMEGWLGEKNAADALAQSVPHNITSEMGLELLDVADVIRPYPAVVSFLENASTEEFINKLDDLDGGKESKLAILHFLDKYGMRGMGEIDITRPRWCEKPSLIIPMLLLNLKQFSPGESKRRFDKGLREASRKEQNLLDRLKQLPDGEHKAWETKRMISQLRDLSGYREYPKYSNMQRTFIYKQALLKEAEQLVLDGVIHQKEDIFFLTFEELQQLVQTRAIDQSIIRQRKIEYTQFEKLTPPRVLTSDGEMLNGSYKKENFPVGAIAGLAVSSGVVEGRARVLFNFEKADLREGDILITKFTDPGWTPLFVSVKGLITEVGGLMTHGAVIAREYGLPAVVGVENATKLIRDGQRIRVNGTDGYIEIL